MVPIDRSPAQWDLDSLRQEWLGLCDEVAREASLAMPATRVRYQADLDGIVGRVFDEWPGLNDEERVNAWERLCEAATVAAQHIAPICVRSGECCRASSPTLHPEDADLVRTEVIPWSMLFTLRTGELARRPGEAEPVAITGEQIKIREKPGSHECGLFDSEHEACAIYDYRPLQCRAQACWDPTPARALVDRPRLGRQELFADVAALLEVLAAHDARCSFASLRGAVDALTLAPTQENADRLVEIIAFEEHFRSRLADELDIPAETLDLILGRSFSDLVRTLGFEVRHEPDGSRVVIPRD
jgi:Fe-S-cluster containining protein